MSFTHLLDASAVAGEAKESLVDILQRIAAHKAGRGQAPAWRDMPASLRALHFSRALYVRLGHSLTFLSRSCTAASARPEQDVRERGREPAAVSGDAAPPKRSAGAPLSGGAWGVRAAPRLRDCGVQSSLPAAPLHFEPRPCTPAAARVGRLLCPSR